MREVSPALLQRSCEIACLSDVIASLPDGLDTAIGERGHSLSGGERQRVGIARAICRNAPILLLDEATSALDSVTEKAVMERLVAEHDDRTMLIVTHRLSTLKAADRVVMFDRGQLVEQDGPHDPAEQRESTFSVVSAVQTV
jgi:ABC-type multidrug transport system fused ATPase/permease subunit